MRTEKQPFLLCAKKTKKKQQLPFDPFWGLFFPPSLCRGRIQDFSTTWVLLRQKTPAYSTASYLNCATRIGFHCADVYMCMGVLSLLSVYFSMSSSSLLECVYQRPFFLFLYRELPLCCLVWLDRSVSPGVIYCFHNFQSECCVLRRRGGGGGNLSSYRYSKVFFDLQTGLIRNFGGGSEELFGFCVAWPPVYQSRYTWHKHKIVRTPAKIVGTVFVFWLSITFLHSSGGASFRNGSKEK